MLSTWTFNCVSPTLTTDLRPYHDGWWSHFCVVRPCLPVSVSPLKRYLGNFTKFTTSERWGQIWTNMPWFWSQKVKVTNGQTMAKKLVGAFSRHRSLNDDSMNWRVMCGFAILGKSMWKVRGYNQTKYGNKVRRIHYGAQLEAEWPTRLCTFMCAIRAHNWLMERQKLDK